MSEYDGFLGLLALSLETQQRPVFWNTLNNRLAPRLHTLAPIVQLDATSTAVQATAVHAPITQVDTISTTGPALATSGPTSVTSTTGPALATSGPNIWANNIWTSVHAEIRSKGRGPDVGPGFGKNP